MKKIIHPAIRAAVIERLKSDITDVTYFDGRPANIDKDELPAVAVYITDAKQTDEYLDEDKWSAVLHVEVFLEAKATDTELDNWMEGRIIPLMNDIPALDELLENSAYSSYDYHRDDEMALWGSADYQIQISYLKSK